MTKQYTSIHAEAGLHRKLVLFAVQLEGYLAHFPNCHKYTLTQGIRAAFLDVYNLVTEAQKRYQKKTTLCARTSYQHCAPMPAEAAWPAWCQGWATPGAPPHSTPY